MRQTFRPLVLRWRFRLLRLLDGWRKRPWHYYLPAGWKYLFGWLASWLVGWPVWIAVPLSASAPHCTPASVPLLKRMSYQAPQGPPPGQGNQNQSYYQGEKGNMYQQQPQQGYYQQQQPPQQYYQQQPQQGYYQQQQPQPVYVQQQQPQQGRNDDCCMACLAALCVCCTLDALF